MKDVFNCSGHAIQSAARHLRIELAEVLYHQLALSLQRHGHSETISLQMTNQNVESRLSISWNNPLSKEEARWYSDDSVRVENAAIAFAIMFMPEFTDYRVVAQSNKQFRIDYFLEPKITESTDDTYIFGATDQQAEVSQGPFAEISGIDKESGSNTIANRRREKIRRLDDPGGTGSNKGVTYVAISEFGKPAFDLYLT